MNRVVVFIMTLLASQVFYGQIGIFSLIKKPLKQEFGFTETFLGLLDALTQLGMFIGNFVLLLFPLSRPKRDFFISCTLQSILSIMLLFAKLGGAEMIFAIIVLILGILKTTVFCPVIIMNSAYDPQTDSYCLNIWMSLFSLGDLSALLFGEIIMNKLNLDWSIYILLTSLIFFFVALLFYLLLEEVPIELENEGTFLENLKEKAQMVKQTLTCRKKLVVIVDFTLLEALFYNGFMWYPYYFVLIGYETYATYLTCTISLSVVVGSLTFENLMKCSGIKPDKFMILTMIVMVAFQVALVVVNRLPLEQNEAVIFYFILCFIAGVALSGPWVRICSSETMEAGEGDPLGLYYVLLTQQMMRCLFSFISLFAVGALMEHNPQSFFVFLLINGIVQLIFTTIHRTFKEESVESQSSL